jgi:hypothetical protein
MAERGARLPASARLRGNSALSALTRPLQRTFADGTSTYATCHLPLIFTVRGTWKTDLAISKPIVVMVCMGRSSGGAVHSINSRFVRRSNALLFHHLVVVANS